MECRSRLASEGDAQHGRSVSRAYFRLELWTGERSRRLSFPLCFRAGSVRDGAGRVQTTWRKFPCVPRSLAQRSGTFRYVQEPVNNMAEVSAMLSGHRRQHKDPPREFSKPPLSSFECRPRLMGVASVAETFRHVVGTFRHVVRKVPDGSGARRKPLIVQGFRRDQAAPDGGLWVRHKAGFVLSVVLSGRSLRRARSFWLPSPAGRDPVR